jgi:phosphatidate cytidylyltransferase
MKTRVFTALVLAAAMLAIVLWLPPIATIVVLAAGVLFGAWEWSVFLRAPGKLARGAYVVVIAALLALAWRYTADPEGLGLVLSLSLAWWVIALGWIMFAPRRVAGWSAALAGVFALVPAWVALMRMRLDLTNGAQWLLFVLILVWVADMGAFFFGRRYGRLRLAPAVSPGKTWEGVLGGALLSSVVAVCGSIWFHIPLAFFLPLCLTTVAFSIVGDLTESLLKRFAGVKDSGSVFPGHGGVMDRIDSVTGAAPVLLFGLTAFGVSP